MDFTSIGEGLKEIVLSAIVVIGGAALGFKKIMKEYSKDDLAQTKTKAEKGVIELIYERLQELEKINRALTIELETLREENMQTRKQNEEMRNEIQKLKKFIELNFTHTYDDPES